MRGKQSVKSGVWYIGGKNDIEKEQKEDKEGGDFQ